MIDQVLVKDKNALRKIGFEALNEKLGPIGMVEFINQFDSGYGDYTKDRHKWLDNVSLEDVVKEIKSKNEPPFPMRRGAS